MAGSTVAVIPSSSENLTVVITHNSARIHGFPVSLGMTAHFHGFCNNAAAFMSNPG